MKLQLPDEIVKAIGEDGTVFDPIVKYAVGEISDTNTKSDAMVFSGWLSTPDVDLSNEVIDVAAFPLYIDWYKRNALYCYNHDISMPMGKVMDVQVVSQGQKQGLYLNDITLVKIPPVEQYLWPMIRDGVLTQQSIGFYSLRGKMIGDVYHHTLVYVLEGSSVPVACNPQAVLDSIKCLTKGAVLDPSFKALETMDDLMEAYNKGILRLPSEVRSKHYVDGFKDDKAIRGGILLQSEEKANRSYVFTHEFETGDLVETNRPEDSGPRKGIVRYVLTRGGCGKNGGQEVRDAMPGNPAVQVEEVDKDLNGIDIAIPCNASELTLLKSVKELGDKPVNKKPDFADVVVLRASTPMDADGAEVVKPRKNQKGYATTCDTLFAAKSEQRGSYLFQIAVPTEKGYRYDFKQAAVSMARALGASGGFHMAPDQKAAVVERIGEAYEALGKAVPVVTLTDAGESYELKITDVEAAVLANIPYDEVKWMSEEPTIVQLALFKNDVSRVSQTLQSWTKDGGELSEEAKSIVTKDLYGYVSLDLWAYMSDPDAVSLLVQVMQLIMASDEDDCDGDTVVFLMEAEEGDTKTPNWAMLAKRFVEKAIEAGQLPEEALSKSLQEVIAAKKAAVVGEEPHAEVSQNLKRLLA